jgi:hypothetical protein
MRCKCNVKFGKGSKTRHRELSTGNQKPVCQLNKFSVSNINSGNAPWHLPSYFFIYI